MPAAALRSAPLLQNLLGRPHRSLAARAPPVRGHGLVPHPLRRAGRAGPPPVPPVRGGELRGPGLGERRLRRRPDARHGLHGDALTRWTEEYQAAVYAHQLDMLDAIPSLCGLSPWILADFRSPRRPLPGVQDGWNRKGLLSDRGERKLAFGVLQAHYRRLAGRAGR